MQLGYQGLGISDKSEESNELFGESCVIIVMPTPKKWGEILLINLDDASGSVSTICNTSDVLAKVVTGNEIWVSHFESLLKQEKGFFFQCVSYIPSKLLSVKYLYYNERNRRIELLAGSIHCIKPDSQLMCDFGDLQSYCDSCKTT